jgi:hypothetical protein
MPIQTTDNTAPTPPAEAEVKFSSVLRGISWLVSTLFHPVFVPLIMSLFILHTHPVQFADFTPLKRFKLIAAIVEETLVLPVFTVIMLKVLKFIQSVFLHERKDRIVPYMATMIYYFLLYTTLHRQTDTPVPLILTVFTLGNFITVTLVFMANIFYKISAHAAAAGGMLGVLLLMLPDPYLNITLPLMAGILLTGLILTSRLILSAHDNFQVYSGLAVGILSQLIAMLVI